jgi:protein ImuA
MFSLKSDIITRLKKEILQLQGLKNKLSPGEENILPAPIKYSFPGDVFPGGAIHEFISSNAEEGAASSGFLAGLLSSLMQNHGIAIWISTSQKIFPPALKGYGIRPDKIIFVCVRNENEILWCTEEALKCDGLAAVIAEIKDLNFTESRRFQLAVEQSRVTGFIIRHCPGKLNITASVTRWQIRSLPGYFDDDMPGVAFPRWQVELLKVRNGKPGNWEMEWREGKFRHVEKQEQGREELLHEQRKTG